jgi:hypothetical protein
MIWPTRSSHFSPFDLLAALVASFIISKIEKVSRHVTSNSSTAGDSPVNPESIKSSIGG